MKRLVYLGFCLVILFSVTPLVYAEVNMASEVSRLQAIVASLQQKLNQLLNQAIERATLGNEVTSLTKLPTATPSAVTVNSVTTNGINEPKRSTTTFIDSLMPSSGPVGTVVTIRGRGFATSSPGNTIYASYQIIKGVKSKDGTTLTFTASAFDNDFAGPNVFKNRQAGRTVTLPLIVAVQNDTGISNDLTFNVIYQAPIYEPNI